ncbi:MAG: hypothetical protein MRJ96_14465 [Nitrospirales bacterium]|nr:hypothetical protein [Nitrospira sp.]MDR4502644.1 hypothetical protein [Nitrospirales bacterium]
MCKVKRLLVFIGLLAVLSSSGFAQAECLGLGLPAPQRTNVCETLLEELVVHKTEVFCDLSLIERFALPDCNLPVVCQADPTCKAVREIKLVGSHILNAGELYCDFRDVQPEKLIENIAQDRFTDLVKLTTGGTSSILFTVSAAHIDTLECGAKALTPELKDVIQHLVDGTSLSRDRHFYSIDLDRVKIIQRSVLLGDLYLREGFDGITLDSLVIVQDAHHQILTGWTHTWDDVRFGHLSAKEEESLILMIHKLVHYRQMGREQFVNRYLAEAIQKGYANISTEEEA